MRVSDQYYDKINGPGYKVIIGHGNKDIRIRRNKVIKGIVFCVTYSSIPFTSEAIIY
jgi:hypothetical protein